MMVQVPQVKAYKLSLLYCRRVVPLDTRQTVSPILSVPSSYVWI